MDFRFNFLAFPSRPGDYENLQSKYPDMPIRTTILVISIDNTMSVEHLYFDSILFILSVGFRQFYLFNIENRPVLPYGKMGKMANKLNK